MTDTTNHAEVIREALQCLKKNAFDGYGNPMPANANEAIESLDALTRELAETKRDWAFNISLAEGAVKEQQATIAAQSERIAKLESENRDMRLALARGCPSVSDPNYAALAPKEAQG
ncbi:hypothetical protein [Geothrix campi]|uniref:hypothetical protein n=1 Tax=Geothrix campi TaxID=2966450 RepID=UPI002147F868|nr:hypothetical protein [Geothrix sp. SG10]